MRRHRPNLSITLPKNFTFHYSDTPKTPEHPLEDEPTQPSPPRARPMPRPRVLLESHSQPSTSLFYSDDFSMPSIEHPNSFFTSIQPSNLDVPLSADYYLAPVSARTRMIKSPRTPVAQIYPSGEDVEKARPDWAILVEAKPENIIRPDSACSGFSESSSSSSGSSLSFPSNGGSVTSPENELADPFQLSRETKDPKAGVGSLEAEKRRLSKRRRLQRNKPWTEEMDNHLWSTYLLYLQDPTVTPFKVPPGSAPPLGVCHRVAREAKQTWKGSRHSITSISDTRNTRLEIKRESGLRDPLDDINAVPAVCTRPAATEPKSGSVTPKQEIRKPIAKWSKSESATRRRLRLLCNQRAAPNPVQARMLSPRGLTPFNSRTRAVSTPSHIGSTPFSTRDMNLSLAMSTSSMMQPGSFLAAFSQEEPEATPDNENWFNSDITQSTGTESIGMGLGIKGLQHANTFPSQLGSPFNPVSSQPHRRTRSRRVHDAQPKKAREVPTTRLGSPVYFSSNSMKRRAQHQLEEELSQERPNLPTATKGDFNETLPETGHRRVRSRGFSLGDVSEGGHHHHHLTDIFTPPVLYDQMSSTEIKHVPTFLERDADSKMSSPIAPRIQRAATTTEPNEADSRMSSPEVPRIRPLGSPFSETKPNDHLLSHAYLQPHSSVYSIATFPRAQPSLFLGQSIGQSLEDLAREREVCDEASRKRKKGSSVASD
ncbi:MAG: hypothetical protein M1824_003217 [Vezdaea acicularis]|nr:MAG: hypothetical protein M1824_003217 [Vezdaea acicularis]